MKLEQIIEMYGRSDYMDMNCPGRIYHLSKMEYHPNDGNTHVPVSENGEVIGIVKLKGDLTK